MLGSLLKAMQLKELRPDPHLCSCLGLIHMIASPVSRLEETEAACSSPRSSPEVTWCPIHRILALPVSLQYKITYIISNIWMQIYMTPGASKELNRCWVLFLLLCGRSPSVTNARKQTLHCSVYLVRSPPER